MSEVLLKKELAARPRELGAVACASCPFAQLGCPKQGTGDCPPPEVIEAKHAAVLFEDNDVSTVWATEGGFEGILQKPKEQLANIQSLSSVVTSRLEKPRATIEKPKQKVERKAPKRRGQSLGEFIASLLFPVPKAT